MNEVLDIRKFSVLSAERAEQGFKTYKNVPITYWTTALAGEVGELCNMIKKIERVAHGGIDGGSSYAAASLTPDDLKEEIGGIYIYLDILSGLLGVDISDAIIHTFNSKSEKYGFEQKYESPSPSLPETEQGASKRIYIASKTAHADAWKSLRDVAGLNIISTWIDEAGKDASPDLEDLCRRCIEECAAADAVIVYREDGEYLKGAFIEMGIAMALIKAIYLIGPVLPPGSVFTHRPNVYSFLTIEDAVYAITGERIKQSEPASAPPPDQPVPEEVMEYRFKEGELTVLYHTFQTMYSDEESLPGYPYFKEGYRLTRAEIASLQSRLSSTEAERDAIKQAFDLQAEELRKYRNQ